MRFQVQSYAEFDQSQLDMPIMHETDDFKDLVQFIRNYFASENYFNAVFLTDTENNKSAYVGRDLTVNCGESIEHFCGEPEDYDRQECVNIKEILKDYTRVYNTPSGPMMVMAIPYSPEFDKVRSFIESL